MVIAELVSAETYEKLALANPKVKWELYHGQLREKPLMSVSHGQAPVYLATQLTNQLDPDRYRAGVNHGRLKAPNGNYYIPDVIVRPFRLIDHRRGRPDQLDAYVDPLPLVVEVWSDSTGDYDVQRKIPDYVARGDWEIWLLNPYRRLLTAWRRQPDDAYERVEVTRGKVTLHALPMVTIDLDEMFDWS